MKNYTDIAVQVGEVLLPAGTVDASKWAVIACDQYTSQPEYWQKAKELVGSAPSTLNLILPEVYLGTDEENRRIESSQAAMREYLAGSLLVPHEGFILVERVVDSKARRGLMMSLDLERYDFSKGSQSLIRATEGTIVERLPPRIRIRQGAPLELPHILVLIDDPEKTVIEPLVEATPRLMRLYDTELMMGSGHLRGFLVDDPVEEARIVAALCRLADPEHFRQKYDVDEDKGVLLFAVGDGNHSLATAKSIWEKLKPQVGMEHPARYALVEVENVHDEGLEFEPIHRVLFGVKEDWQTALREHFSGQAQITPAASPERVIADVKQQASEQSFGVLDPQGAWIVTVSETTSNLPVGTLQSFLDLWMKAGGAEHIDYVHGDEVLVDLAKQEGNLCFYLPAMDKSDLFKTVILDGSLPRKTFSMGEAHAKRFYMESRRITA